MNTVQNFTGLTINVFRPTNEKPGAEYTKGDLFYPTDLISAVNERIMEDLEKKFPGAEIRQRSARDRALMKVLQGECDPATGEEKFSEYFKQLEEAVAAITQQRYEQAIKEATL